MVNELLEDTLAIAKELEQDDCFQRTGYTRKGKELCDIWQAHLDRINADHRRTMSLIKKRIERKGD